MKKNEISFLIPAYNESGNIIKIYNEIKNNFSEINYEIVFVNDGSTDDTLKEMKLLLKEKSNKIKIIDFSRNFGKESAILAALNESNGKFTCIIDADLQQPPRIAKDMYNFLIEGNGLDSVVAFQKERKDTKIRNYFSDLFYKVINHISEVEFYKSASDFRIFNEKVKDAILSMKEKNRFSKGLFAYVGFNNYYYGYAPDKRLTGNTKWTITKLFKYSILGMTAFSSKPLLLPWIFFLFNTLLVVMYIGLLFFKTSIEFSTVYLFIWKYITISMVFISFLIIGIYIDRVLKEQQNRPLYFIKEIIENEKQKI